MLSGGGTYAGTGSYAPGRRVVPGVRTVGPGTVIPADGVVGPPDGLGSTGVSGSSEGGRRRPGLAGVNSGDVLVGGETEVASSSDEEPWIVLRGGLRSGMSRRGGGISSSSQSLQPVS
jgi:hypothetical protein